MEQWKIQRDRTRCEKPGCPLAGAEEYYAVLELPDCVRRDLCQMCFHQLGSEPGEEPIYWKGVRKAPGKKAPVLDLQSLRLLFDRLAQSDNESAQGLRYFVALLLIRKRVLKMTDPVTEEQELADMIVIDPKRKDLEPVALFAPELDTDRLAGLKDELLAAIGEGEADSEAQSEGAEAAE